MTLEGRTAIVTGGARGIGLAIVRRLLADGARVVIADIDEEAGESAVARLAAKDRLDFVSADVSERLDIHNLVAATLDRFGDIDILVNNAGTLPSADFLTLGEADLDRTLRVNLKGAFLCGQAVARHMIERGRGSGWPGSIVNLSSLDGVVALPDQIGCRISVGGVDQLTQVMALSLAPYGIRVNAVGPGPVRGDSARADGEEDGDAAPAGAPLAGIRDPDEIAGAVAFLVSDDAGSISGQTLLADGRRLRQQDATKLRPG